MRWNNRWCRSEPSTRQRNFRGGRYWSGTSDGRLLLDYQGQRRSAHGTVGPTDAAQTAEENHQQPPLQAGGKSFLESRAGGRPASAGEVRGLHRRRRARLGDISISANRVTFLILYNIQSPSDLDLCRADLSVRGRKAVCDAKLWSARPQNRDVDWPGTSRLAFSQVVDSSLDLAGSRSVYCCVSTRFGRFAPKRAGPGRVDLDRRRRHGRPEINVRPFGQLQPFVTLRLGNIVWRGEGVAKIFGRSRVRPFGLSHWNSLESRFQAAQTFCRPNSSRFRVARSSTT